MKESIAEIKKQMNNKLLFWHSLKSKKIKAGIIVLFLAIIALKIFTTVITFDWLADLLS